MPVLRHSELVVRTIGFCLIGLLALPVRSDVKEDARKGIQRAYDAQDAALARKDLNGYFASHAPDYVSIGKQGHTSGIKEERQGMTEFIDGSWSSGQFRSEIQEITLNDKQGNQGTVTIHRTGRAELTDPQTGRHGTLETDARVRDFWQKGRTGWQLKREKVLSLKAFMNGKPLGNG